MKKAYLTLTALLMIGVVFSGCGSESKDKKADKKDDVINLSTDEQNEMYNQLFDLNNKISVSIDIPEDEIAKIQEDFTTYDRMSSKSPIYRKADNVTITIGDKSYVIPEVGVRMKGNLSRTDFYSESKGVYNLIHLKLSFNQTFDDENYYGKDAEKWSSDEERQARKDRTFAGLSSLELKWNRNYDNTYVRQIYCYQMFKDQGLLAPNMTLAQVSLDDKNYGVFSVNEPVDKKFIKRNLPEEEWGGDLYKGGWTYTPANYTLNMTYGIDNSDERDFYNLDLKTNKSTSKNEALEHLLEVINAPEVSKEQFESVVDTENWLKFAAVSYFAGNPDDLRNNYNNHYVYFSPNTGKAYFIAYDYDRCFGITHSWNPDATGMTEASPFSESADGNGQKQANPLYKYSILSSGYYIEQYKNALADVAASKWMNIDTFNEYYETAKKNYADETTPDMDFYNAVENRFDFNNDGEFVYGDDDNNMSMKEYLDRIMDTYKKTIAP